VRHSRKDACAELLKIVFRPAILDRFPEKDYPDSPLAVALPIFCFPLGATFTEVPSDPHFHATMLTNTEGTRTYAYSLVFTERVPDYAIPVLSKLFPQDFPTPARCAGAAFPTLYWPRAISLLTHYPFMAHARDILGRHAWSVRGSSIRARQPHEKQAS